MTDKKYKRNCPVCQKEIFHTNIKNCNRAIKVKKLCNSCGVKLNHADVTGKNNPFYGKHHTNETKNKWKQSRNYDWLKTNNPMFNSDTRNIVSEKLSGKRNPMYGKTKENNPFYKKRHTTETKLKIQARCKGLNIGIPKTEPHKLKIRLAHINRIKKLGYYWRGNYNSTACEYFDKLNKQNGWNLQHALNGGELNILGYQMDSYDKNRNIIIEYDEPHHYTITGELKNKDVIRMNKIIQYLNCQFFRFNEKTQTLKEYYLPTSAKYFVLASSYGIPGTSE